MTYNDAFSGRGWMAGVRLASCVSLFGLLTVVPALASSSAPQANGSVAGLDESLADRAPTSEGPKSPVNGVVNCSLVGPRYHQIGSLVACGRITLDGLAFATKEFVGDDIVLHGYRLPSFAGGFVPTMFYRLNDYRNDAHYPKVSGLARVSYHAAAVTSYGIVEGAIGVRLYGSAHWLRDGSFQGSLVEVDGSKLRGALDHAWVRFHGLHVGYAPSYFGFNRFGYTFLPAYLTTTNLPLLAYNFHLTKDTSLTLSIEDAKRRRREDGVLAAYADSDRPNMVATLRHRLNKRWLVHASGVTHRVKDKWADFCCNAGKSSETGFAATLGTEYYFRWGDLLGSKMSNDAASVMANVTFARGAIDYLGVPNVVPDYVTTSDGRMKLSEGVSVVMGYRHFITRKLRASVTASAFRVEAGSKPEQLDLFNSNFNFDYKMDSWKLQGTVSYIVNNNLEVGAEAGYTQTKAKLKYSIDNVGQALSAAPLRSSYPEVTLFVRAVW